MLGLPPADRHRFKGWTDDIYGFMGFSAVPVAEKKSTCVEKYRNRWWCLPAKRAG